MDKTETYIKMCEKVEEIQDNRWYKGELVDTLLGVLEFRIQVDELDNLWYQGIWLPRQYQLRGMMGLHWREFDKESWDMVVHYGQGLETKEVASLMLLMKKKYNKIWDGADWVCPREMANN